MIKLEIANINLLERIKKGQVNFMKKKITAILMVILIGIMAAGCGQQQKTEQDHHQNCCNLFFHKIYLPFLYSFKQINVSYF